MPAGSGVKYGLGIGVGVVPLKLSVRVGGRTIVIVKQQRRSPHVLEALMQAWHGGQVSALEMTRAKRDHSLGQFLHQYQAWRYPDHIIPSAILFQSRL